MKFREIFYESRRYSKSELKDLHVAFLKKYNRFDISKIDRDIPVDKNFDESKIKITGDLIKKYWEDIIRELKSNKQNINKIDTKDFFLKVEKSKREKRNIAIISLWYKPPEFEEVFKGGDFIPKRGYSFLIKNVSNYFKK